LGINKQIQGWGLFAGEPIKKGEFIGEYAGEVNAINQTNSKWKRLGNLYAYSEND